MRGNAMSFWFGIAGGFILIGFVLGKIGWAWMILGALLLYVSITRFVTRYKAASNALLARYTFDHLSEPDREKVLTEVSSIMLNAGHEIQESDLLLKDMSPAQRYGFLALGMAGVGIKPKIGGLWYSVRNPYADILGADREIAWAKHQIKNKYSVDVDLYA